MGPRKLRDERRRKRLRVAAWVMGVAIVLAWAFLAFGSPVDASDWDQLLPDEVGAALFVLPAVDSEDRGVPAVSWHVYRLTLPVGATAAAELDIYATVLRPHHKPGGGLDGTLGGSLRVGIGWLPPDMWGLYFRQGF